MFGDCPFCRIVRSELPAVIVYETARTLAFLPRQPEVYGHTLVVPKTHYATIFEIPVPVLASVMDAVQTLGLLYREKIGAAGINILHASGEDAQQSVGHLHVHLLPRFPNDGLNTWPDLQQVSMDDEAFLRRLRE